MFPRCPYCSVSNSPDLKHPKIVRHGSFRRKSDSRWIVRFRCSGCRRSFSAATRNICFRQKKRPINEPLRVLLASGVSIRRAAKNLKINKATVLRRLRFLGKKAALSLKEAQKKYPLVQEWQFDDLETFEHSKYKPLSITLAVEAKTRRILSFEIAQMPAKGLLAQRARKKYGRRLDERRRARHRLFEYLKDHVHANSSVTSDENPHYPFDVKRFFPKATHNTVKGKRGCITGQGELKKTGFDPLFSLNHTCAMFRANVNRLFRKTWCTTKKRENLAFHLAIYAQFHNEELI